MHTQNGQYQEWKVCVSSCYNIDPQKIKAWHTKFFSRLLDSVKFIMFKSIYSMHFESVFFIICTNLQYMMSQSPLYSNMFHHD